MVSINRFGMLYIYFSNTPGNQSCARVIVCELSKYLQILLPVSSISLLTCIVLRCVDFKKIKLR